MTFEILSDFEDYQLSLKCIIMMLICRLLFFQDLYCKSVLNCSKHLKNTFYNKTNLIWTRYYIFSYCKISFCYKPWPASPFKYNKLQTPNNYGHQLKNFHFHFLFIFGAWTVRRFLTLEHHLPTLFSSTLRYLVSSITIHKTYGFFQPLVSRYYCLGKINRFLE